MRRIVTRTAAVVPALIVLVLMGGSGAMQLLIASQVVLSLQLPFAIIPLLRFTNSRGLMGKAANGRIVRTASALCATAVCVANGCVLQKTFQDLQAVNGTAAFLFGALCLAGTGLLIWICFVPLRTTPVVITPSVDVLSWRQA